MFKDGPPSACHPAVTHWRACFMLDALLKGEKLAVIFLSRSFADLAVILICSWFKSPWTSFIVPPVNYKVIARHDAVIVYCTFSKTHQAPACPRGASSFHLHPKSSEKTRLSKDHHHLWRVFPNCISKYLRTHASLVYTSIFMSFKGIKSVFVKWKWSN